MVYLDKSPKPMPHPIRYQPCVFCSFMAITKPHSAMAQKKAIRHRLPQPYCRRQRLVTIKSPTRRIKRFCCHKSWLPNHKSKRRSWYKKTKQEGVWPIHHRRTGPWMRQSLRRCRVVWSNNQSQDVSTSTSIGLHRQINQAQKKQ